MNSFSELILKNNTTMSSLAALSEDEQFAVQRFNGLGMVSREGVTEANVGALLEKIDGKRSSLFLF